MNRSFQSILFSAVGLILLSSGGAMAGSLTVPNEFSPNTPAEAEKVNENFNATKAAVDDNNTRIDTNAANITSNTDAINTIQSGIQARAVQTCPEGSHIIGFNLDGTFVCSCSGFSSIGLPTLHITSGGTQGQWMSDPLETLGAGKIWEMAGFNNVTSITEYASLADMIASNPTDSWVLPVGIDGTGSVIYDGYLYYNKTNSRNMIKYNLSTRLQEFDVILPNAGFRNTYAYQWGGFSDIDFAVDEEGLWVIYATAANAGNIVISKLSPNTLTVIQSWNTSRSKSAGNAFMVCGVLYVIASYNATDTTIDYKFDTRTLAETDPAIPFTNPGGYNSMVDYNPNDGLLYSWDNRRHQTYQVIK